MHQSTKREQHVPASSPPKKAKAPAPGNQMIAPSGSSSRNHLGGDVPVSISSKPKANKPDIEPEDEDETDPQAGPSSGTPLLPIDDGDAANVPVPNDDKSDTLEYHSSQIHCWVFFSTQLKIEAFVERIHGDGIHLKCHLVFN